MNKLNTLKIIVCLSTILVMSLDATRRKRAPNDSYWSRVSNAFSGCLRKTTRTLAVSTLIIPGTASPLPCDNTPINHNPALGNEACEDIRSIYRETKGFEGESPTIRTFILNEVVLCNNRDKILQKMRKTIKALEAHDQLMIDIATRSERNPITPEPQVTKRKNKDRSK